MRGDTDRSLIARAPGRLGRNGHRLPSPANYIGLVLLFSLIALLVIAYVYREDLGLRGMLVYASIWTVGLCAMLLLDLSPGVFVALQCLLAIAILIQVGANPDVPR